MTTTSATSGANATTGATNTNKSKSAEMSDASDRFLKLLVTQMQNQDPLNPLDNAQVTSQMAQINTVTGIDKLNTTMTNMGSNMTQMQMLQGTSLVGRTVRVEGNMLNMGSDGKGYGSFELAGAASNVKIEVLNSAGLAVDTINKTGLPSGANDFDWAPPTGTATDGLTFKVTATSGGQSITSKPMMYDQVDAVSTTNGVLNLELRNAGPTSYSKIQAVAS
jgi:flagellar basal-body rod modification protein FlgD